MVILCIYVALARSLIHRFAFFKKKMKVNFITFPAMRTKKIANLCRILWKFFSAQDSASQSPCNTFPYNSSENLKIPENNNKSELHPIFEPIGGMTTERHALNIEFRANPKNVELMFKMSVGGTPCLQINFPVVVDPCCIFRHPAFCFNSLTSICQ